MAPKTARKLEEQKQRSSQADPLKEPKAERKIKQSARNNPHNKHETPKTTQESPPELPLWARAANPSDKNQPQRPGINRERQSSTAVTQPQVSQQVPQQVPRYPRNTPNSLTPKFTYLDATHTSSEQKVYSVLYRESKQSAVRSPSQSPKQSSIAHVRLSVSELTERTGLSDKTVRNSLHTLVDKLSIAIVEDSQGIYGRVYQIFDPKAILDARSKAGFEIDKTTKKIISMYSTSTSPDRSSERSTPVDSPARTPVSTGPIPTAVTADAPTAVKTPYKEESLNKNNINIYKSSSTNANIPDDIKDDGHLDKNPYDHKTHIKQLYELYTGNRWNTSDETFYGSISGVLPDVIEAALIASVLRCPTRVNSLAYSEGGIEEYQELLPMGYVSYLRRLWRENRDRLENPNGPNDPNDNVGR